VSSLWHELGLDTPHRGATPPRPPRLPLALHVLRACVGGCQRKPSAAQGVVEAAGSTAPQDPKEV